MTLTVGRTIPNQEQTTEETDTKQQREKNKTKKRTMGATDFSMPVELKDYNSYRKRVPREAQRNKSLCVVLPRAVATATTCAACITGHVIVPRASTASAAESDQSTQTECQKD